MPIDTPGSEPQIDVRRTLTSNTAGDCTGAAARRGPLATVFWFRSLTKVERSELVARLPLATRALQAAEHPRTPG